MLLEDLIFTLYGGSDKALDTNKDVNGEGTLERFNKVMGKDYDDNIAPFIDNLLDNTLVPQTCLDEFITYLEEGLGLPILYQNEAFRRKLIKYAYRIYEIKGTLKSYQVLFNWLQFTSITLIEHDTEFSFDSPETFDSPFRRFDTKCAGCGEYSLYLYTGISLTDELHKAIFRTIEFLQPIDARLRAVYFNDILLVGDDMLSIWIDDNGDLNVEDVGSPGTFMNLMPNGDLEVGGDGAENYNIDENGDLTHNL